MEEKEARKLLGMLTYEEKLELLRLLEELMKEKK